MNLQRLLGRVLDWARLEPNVRAVLLTGSMARGEADDLSDLDVELYVADPQPLLGSDEWFEQFGTVAAVEKLDNPGWHPTRLVYYIDAKIDFMIASVAALQKPGSTSDPTPFQVVLDKDDAVHGLQRFAPEQRRPDSDEFARCANAFYAAAIMCAKYLARDEPWLVKLRDWEAKERLLTMIEWDHRARYGWDYDTAYLGTRIGRWADAEIVEALRACWGGFDGASSAEALRATVDLFDRISLRVAEKLDLKRFDTTPARTRVETLLQFRH